MKNLKYRIVLMLILLHSDSLRIKWNIFVYSTHFEVRN